MTDGISFVNLPCRTLYSKWRLNREPRNSMESQQVSVL